LSVVCVVVSVSLAGAGTLESLLHPPRAHKTASAISSKVGEILRIQVY
jgi:hypothetical protein